MKQEPVIVSGRGGISAKIVAHSAHPFSTGRQLVTLQLKYPRFVHSEFLTHRTFSRNSSSSRAIPVPKMLEQVRNDPAMPIHWGVNQPGMKADVEMSAQEAQIAQTYWREAARRAANMAESLHMIGAHKQIANRILEPYQFMNTIVSFTEGENFFELRDHPDAEPTIRELAVCMKGAIAQSEPDQLRYGQWHLPYVDEDELEDIGLEVAKKASAARCARVSYLTHDGKVPNIEKDLELFERLVGSTPMHASPIEHQATPNPSIYQTFDAYTNEGLEGNFVHWVQYRKLWERSKLLQDADTVSIPVEAESL